jgi:hypothetical protein
LRNFEEILPAIDAFLRARTHIRFVSALCFRSYDRSHNVRPKRNIRQAMQHEISMYAICQKEGEF